jgi:hypothetical protein
VPYNGGTLWLAGVPQAGAVDGGAQRVDDGAEGQDIEPGAEEPWLWIGALGADPPGAAPTGAALPGMALPGAELPDAELPDAEPGE